MRKTLMICILAGSVSFPAMADISPASARYDVHEAQMNFNLLNGTPFADDANANYTLTMRKVDQNLTAIDQKIAEGLNYNASCELLTAILTKESFTPSIKNSQKLHTVIMDKSAERLIAAYTTYTMAKCYSML